MRRDLAMVENDRLSPPSLRGHESCFINKAQFPFCRVIFPTKPFCILFCFNSMAASEVISCVFASISNIVLGFRHHFARSVKQISVELT